MFLLTAPVYRESHPPKVKTSGNVIVVSWADCFHINAEVKEFVLFKDDQAEYKGYDIQYNVYRPSQYRSKYSGFVRYYRVYLPTTFLCLSPSLLPTLRPPFSLVSLFPPHSFSLLRFLSLPLSMSVHPSVPLSLSLSLSFSISSLNCLDKFVY